MSDSLTLAFDLDAIEPLEAPAAAFEDARRWSTYVGVVSNTLAYRVINTLREEGIYDEDFFSRADRAESLRSVRRGTETDRYVFVGTSDEDADLARECGWEYVPVTEAARKADWTLARDPLEQ